MYSSHKHRHHCNFIKSSYYFQLSYAYGTSPIKDTGIPTVKTTGASWCHGGEKTAYELVI